MKKIPTLFERVYENGRSVGISPNVTPGFEWVLAGEGDATVKYDGSCCAIIDGTLYKRYDAKKGKPMPQNAIMCQDEPDAVTGHFPCWVPCDRANNADKWFFAALANSPALLCDGTYEAIGPHFQGNPYKLDVDMLYPHGETIIRVPRSFEGIRDYLEANVIEGIVFWRDGKPQCKIKRRDFGFKWN